MSEISAHQYVGVETLVKDRGGVSFGNNLPDADSAIKFIKEDILIGNIRPYLKKIWMSDRSGGASGDVIVIRITPNNKDNIISPYIFKVLSSNKFFEYDNAHTHGAKMPRGDRHSIAEFIIPVPPLSEQQRIVSELDLLSGIIEKKKAQLKGYDALAQSIFYDMFGDPVTNEKGWEVKKLGEVCLLKAGKAIKSSELKDKADNLYPCYGGNGIRGYIEKISHRDDLPIIGRQGALCGNVNFAKAPFYATEHAVVVSPLIEMNKKWLFYGLRFLHLEQYAHGVAQPGIAVNDLKPISFALPPLSLQQSFASKIEAIERQKALIQQSITEAETLFNSRMDYWFS